MNPQGTDRLPIYHLDPNADRLNLRVPTTQAGGASGGWLRRREEWRSPPAHPWCRQGRCPVSSWCGESRLRLRASRCRSSSAGPRESACQGRLDLERSPPEGRWHEKEKQQTRRMHSKYLNSRCLLAGPIIIRDFRLLVCVSTTLRAPRIAFISFRSESDDVSLGFPSGARFIFFSVAKDLPCSVSEATVPVQFTVARFWRGEA